MDTSIDQLFKEHDNFYIYQQSLSFLILRYYTNPNLILKILY